MTDYFPAQMGFATAMEQQQSNSIFAVGFINQLKGQVVKRMNNSIVGRLPSTKMVGADWQNQYENDFNEPTVIVGNEEIVISVQQGWGGHIGEIRVCLYDQKNLEDDLIVNSISSQYQLRSKNCFLIPSADCAFVGFSYDRYISYAQGVFYRLKSSYSIKNEQKTFEFIENNQIGFKVLDEASEKLKVYFPDSELVVDVIDDPEAENISKLVVFVNTKQNPEKAFFYLNSFDEDWYFKLSEKISEKLIFKLELK